jgi:hypothetical protein
MIISNTWILRTAVLLHNKRIALEEEEQIAVPSWYYATCVAFLALMADVLLVASLVAALDNKYLLEAILLAFALRLLVHAAVLAWLLPSGYRSAMIVQVFEVGIALTLAPVVGSIAAVVLAR